MSGCDSALDTGLQIEINGVVNSSPHIGGVVCIGLNGTWPLYRGIGGGFGEPCPLPSAAWFGVTSIAPLASCGGGPCRWYTTIDLNGTPPQPGFAIVCFIPTIIDEGLMAERFGFVFFWADSYGGQAISVYTSVDQLDCSAIDILYDPITTIAAPSIAYCEFPTTARLTSV